MESQHGDFWGHVDAAAIQAQTECSRVHSVGELAKYERDWLDADTGKIDRLSTQAWFRDATKIARQIATRSLRRALQDEVGYYRFAEHLLVDDTE